MVVREGGGRGRKPEGSVSFEIGTISKRICSRSALPKGRRKGPPATSAHSPGWVPSTRTGRPSWISVSATARQKLPLNAHLAHFAGAQGFADRAYAVRQGMGRGMAALVIDPVGPAAENGAANGGAEKAG